MRVRQLIEICEAIEITPATSPSSRWSLPPAGSWIVQVASVDGRAWTGTVATDGFRDAAVALD
jgi:hypothetical protein